ncbi:MAG: EAL domain-containing protein [Nitrosomonadales bacterium]|nr:EAL domain-containing protein [Nitrosomonadales bacterium]
MSKLLKEKIRLLFAMIVMALTLTVLASGWVLYNLLQNIGQETVQSVQTATGVADEARQAHVIFQRQVQEWKDLLLRGHDAAQFKHHHDAFQAQFDMGQAKLKNLAEVLTAQGLDNSRVLKMRQQHAAMMKQYEAALAQFPLIDALENTSLVDELVRGVDRQLSGEFDELNREVQTLTLARINSVESTVKARYQGEEFYLYLILLAVLPLVGYGSLMMLNRLTRQLVVEKERVQVTLASIGDAVVVTDSRGAVDYLNAVAEAMIGWPLSEARGKPLHEVFHIVNEQTRKLVENPVDVVLREGRIVGLANHTVLISRDGRECAIEDSAAPVRDLAGAIHGVVLVFHDATVMRQAMEASNRQQALFRATFEQAGVGVAHVAPGGTLLRVNQRLCAILGYSEEELLQTTFWDLTHPEDLGLDLDDIRQLLEGESESYQVEKRYLHQDGSIAWVNLTVSLVRKEGGEPDYFIFIVEDISERKRVAAENENLRVQYQTLFEQMPDSVILIDMKGRIVAFNQEALAQYGYTEAEMRTLSVPDLEAKESEAEYQEHKRNIQRFGRDDFETQHRTASGDIIDVRAAIRVVDMPDGSLMFQCAFRDISNEKQAHHQIEFLANHDQLTSLPNRRLLRDRMEVAIGNAARHETKLALLFLDMDHFKVINDTLGHEVGDLLLKSVADRLRTCVREQDTLARIGGDEFVVLLADVFDASDAATVAQKILDTLSVPYLVRGYDLHSTPSIGITLYPDDGISVDALLQQADSAMYHAKEHGRAAFHFYEEEMNQRTQERLATENNLHLALARGEFELYYQPKVDSRDGKLIGGEALIRWQHPEMGVVSPAQFIPIAEQSNLINAIGEWVVMSVCRQTRLWKETGLPCIPISFNVSARQFLYGDLPAMLRRAIESTGADPTMLEMELTESVLMRPQDVAAALGAIKALGFRVALDDFGTGYSSLAYLRRMEIDTIKIDRSFVKDLEHSHDDVVIVRTLIATAQNLRMSVIAEGVETGIQADILCESGCCDCQGYFFGRPMPASEFAELLRDA